MALSAASAIITITNNTVNTRTFAGAGFTYGTLRYQAAGSTGALAITGANTFAALEVSDATASKTVTLPSATTTTLTSAAGFAITGVSGFPVTLNSSTPTSAATLSIASGTVSTDYLTIQDSTATGGATFYAGANSTNVSGNTGWIFGAPPASSNSSFFTLLR